MDPPIRVRGILRSPLVSVNCRLLNDKGGTFLPEHQNFSLAGK